MQTLTLIFIKPTKLASSELHSKDRLWRASHPQEGWTQRWAVPTPCLTCKHGAAGLLGTSVLSIPGSGTGRPEPPAGALPAEQRLPETGARGGLTSWSCTSKCARGQAGLITHNKLPAPAGPRRHSLEGSCLENLKSVCSVLSSPGHNQAQEEKSVLTHSGRTELQTQQSAGHISLTGCPGRLSSGSYHGVCAPHPGRKSHNR